MKQPSITHETPSQDQLEWLEQVKAKAKELRVAIVSAEPTIGMFASLLGNLVDQLVKSCETAVQLRAKGKKP